MVFCPMDPVAPKTLTVLKRPLPAHQKHRPFIHSSIHFQHNFSPFERGNPIHSFATLGLGYAFQTKQNLALEAAFIFKIFKC